MARPGPLTQAEAERLWSRDAIRTFGVPQPPIPIHRLVRRLAPGPGGGARPRATGAKLPAAGDVTVVPDGLAPRRVRSVAGAATPLTVYPPDGRRVFQDTTWPWRVCGRVTTSVGHGAGALVGPRHMLTASHVVNWTSSGCGWIKFQPDYYEGDVFPASYGAAVYSYEQIGPSDIGEYDVAEDYVVVVLGDRLGDTLGGWFGTVGYDSDWDNTSAWSHVGYPDDIGGGTKPAWELWFSVLNSWQPGYFELGHGLDILTHASMNHGDSGGPVFGWWSHGGPYSGDAAGPYIIGVVSAAGELSPVVTNYSGSDRTGNWIGGGSELPDLVRQATGDYP